MPAFGDDRQYPRRRWIGTFGAAAGLQATDLPDNARVHSILVTPTGSASGFLGVYSRDGSQDITSSRTSAQRSLPVPFGFVAVSGVAVQWSGASTVTVAIWYS